MTHYRHQIRAWRDRYRLVVKDLPGHGRHGADLGKGDAFGQMLAAVDDWVSSGPCHILGLSYLGSALALHAAVRHPASCRSVTVTGYAFDMSPGRLQSWATGFLTAAMDNEQARESFTIMHGPRWRTTVERIAGTFPGWYPKVGVTELARAEVPVLVLNGSLLGPERESAADVAGRAATIDAGVIPGAGHMANEDQPEVYRAIVESYWSRTGS